jgi:alpha-galactosidase
VVRSQSGLWFSVLFWLLMGMGTAGASTTGLSLRTPPPGPQPHINGPIIYGVRPGRPFLYRIPCTGTRPMHFSADRLPSSLHLDAETGIISGTAPSTTGKYKVRLVAENARGRSTRDFSIEVGERIGLTPQMGWNDWYSYYDRISAADVRASAEAMVASGMADYEYQYVDIDDAGRGSRDRRMRRKQGRFGMRRARSSPIGGFRTWQVWCGRSTGWD